MPKQVKATNCRVTALPQGWLAKTDGNGLCIISVPDMLAGMFGGTIASPSVSLNGFTATAFDGTGRVELIGVYEPFDTGHFHDVVL